MALQFNPGDSTGIVDEINDICQSDNNNYPLASKARRVNAALDRFFTLAFKADGRWLFDDINHGTIPILTKNIVSGTSRYVLDTFASEIIGILRVEVDDDDGNTHNVERYDRNDDVKWGREEKLTPAGIPSEYDLIGKYIDLYPQPSYNATNGLKLYIHRNKVEFTASSTTTALGIPSIFGQYICRQAAIPYLIETQKVHKNDIIGQIQMDEIEINNHFKNRNRMSQKMMPENEDNH